MARSRCRRRAKSTAPKTTRVCSTGLPVLRTDAAGIDVGSTEHWVCGPPSADGTINVECFGSKTCDLHKLADWLEAHNVSSVAMESTGVYWIPLYELLESRGFEVLLVNAKQLANVPGRKSDVSDCQWIQLLHSCGLLRGSFRPSEQICQLRALMRECSNLIEERSRSIQRMQKSLDQMNVQVHRAVSDITGTTGMSIIRAIVGGERDPLALAGLRDKRCRKSQVQFAEHLRGTWRDEHLFNLGMSLDLYDKLNDMIDAYGKEIAEVMQKMEPEQRRHQQPPQHPSATKARAITSRGEENTRKGLWRFSGVDLTRIDGISTGGANVVFSEVGLDLNAFPTENHFTSWLRLCPHRPISGGKILKNKRRPLSANRVAKVLRMAACSLQRSPTTLGARFRHIARRKGYSVAVFAIARQLAILIYRMLRYGQDYIDQGAKAYEEQFQEKRLQRLKNNAKEMGYELQAINPAA